MMYRLMLNKLTQIKYHGMNEAWKTKYEIKRIKMANVFRLWNFNKRYVLFYCSAFMHSPIDKLLSDRLIFSTIKV